MCRPGFNPQPAHRIKEKMGGEGRRGEEGEKGSQGGHRDVAQLEVLTYLPCKEALNLIPSLA